MINYPLLNECVNNSPEFREWLKIFLEEAQS